MQRLFVGEHFPQIDKTKIRETTGTINRTTSDQENSRNASSSINPFLATFWDQKKWFDVATKGFPPGLGTSYNLTKYYAHWRISKKIWVWLGLKYASLTGWGGWHSLGARKGEKPGNWIDCGQISVQKRLPYLGGQLAVYELWANMYTTDSRNLITGARSSRI